MSLEVDVAEIKTKVAYIEKEIRANLERFEEHIDTAQGFRDKVSAFDPHRKEFEAHVRYDMWLFGTLITMNLAILVKIFT